MNRSVRWIVAFSVLLLVSGGLFAQGTTGKLTGNVTLDGAPLPGVTVTITSPALQGQRVAVTDVNGNYNFGALPPGRYQVNFQMESMQTVTRSADVTLGGTARADATMRLSAVAEAITVTASAPAVLETQEVQTNLDAQTVSDLPIDRTLIGVTTLAPGVNQNGPNAGAVTISGALAADNLFLVNGAVINENLRGQPHNLFIEDAIQETTVQTGAISAEFGRFTGGVVSAITKSGGNEFSGSFRDSLTSPSWTSDSPLQTADSSDDINEVYSGTLGGRIVKDRLWFFTSARYRKLDSPRFFQSSSTPFTTGDEETRYEVKLTGSITPKHTLVGSYLDIKQDQTDNCFIACFEPSNLDTSRSLPNSFITAQYNGIFTSNFLLEATYAKKKFAFEDSGGDSRDRITGTWGYDAGATGAFFGAPVFCGVCPAEERNNSTYGVKGTYYLATKALGTHNVVAGYENWAEERISDNFQSGSDYGVTVYTEPVFTNGILTPIITEGDTIGYFPISVSSKGSDFQTDSLYVNDRWDVNPHWSLNLGVRYDKNDGLDSAGNKVANDSTVSPRLGAIWDVRGDGKYRLNASYSRYVNRVAETIGGAASPAGNPAYFYYEYRGPTISGLPTFDAFRQLFAWFDQSCSEEDPTRCGLDNTDLIVAAGVPGVNTKIQGSLKSPSVDEFTVGFGTQIGRNGFFRADYIDRNWNDFFVVRTDLSTGQVTSSLGDIFDLGFVENTNDLERTYKAIEFQVGYRFRQRWNIGGNYTYSETKGNQTGQTAGSGPVADNTTAPFQYPEFKAFSQFDPVGYLPQDQKHKARLWLSYDLPTQVGNFNFSLLQNYDSATPYSALGTIEIQQYVNSDVVNSYETPPSFVNYYFSDRGEFRWDDITHTDLGINYNLPVWRVNLFVEGEVINIFDEDGQVFGNTTVLTSRQDDTLEPFNPFTDTPVEGVNYRLGSNFGKPRNPTTLNPATGFTAGDFQLPRTYRVAVGIRF